MIRRPASLLGRYAAAFGLMLVNAPPASAMCGGNFLATCAPPANAAAIEANKAKREKRLQAVQSKKRHYPLLKR
jgi:hypothetical protein